MMRLSWKNSMLLLPKIQQSQKVILAALQPIFFKLIDSLGRINKSLSFFWIFILILLNFTGCANQIVCVSPAAKSYRPRSILVKPFENVTPLTFFSREAVMKFKSVPTIYTLNNYKYIPTEADRKAYGLAVLKYAEITAQQPVGRIVADAFQTALLNLGWPVIERSRLKEVLTESQIQEFLTSQGNYDEAKKLARLLDADVLILGKVIIYQQGLGVRMHNAVGFSARAINVNDGTILWSIAVVYESGSLGYTSPTVSSVIKIVDKAVNELIQQGVNVD